MKFPYYAREVYGVVMYYPADKEQAEFYRILTLRKTIRPQDLHALSGLGFHPELVANPNLEGR